MQNVLTPILAAWLVLTLTAVLIWDILVPSLGVGVITVSEQLHTWGSRYPVLYLLLGIAIGHIVLPLVIKNGASQTP